MLKAVGSGTRKLAVDLFHHHKQTPNILLETSNTNFIKEVVQRGEAGAFLAEADISHLIQEGKLVKVPVHGTKMFLEIYITFLKDQPLSQPARAFLKLLGELDLKKHFPYMVSSWPKGFPFKKAAK
jgi:DNA-binding transcriptional LysR family regulator